jgi:hypothetical protein
MASKTKNGKKEKRGGTRQGSGLNKVLSYSKDIITFVAH